MKKKLLLFLILTIFSACTSQKNEISLIKENTKDLEMVATYTEAYEALNRGDTYFAAKKFLESELLYPQSEWAPKSALMASYSFYLQNFYSEALFNLDRYLNTYPTDKNVTYAYYLIAICYFETIEDEKKDIEPILKAKKNFEILVEKFPDTDFALDSKFKLDLIEDLLASKEMYLGRHYQKKNKWVASINRYKNVIENYDETIFAEEAIHRLVEIYYKIGLIEESERYANLLGYNYNSSEWYKKSYKVFNKDYKINEKRINYKDKRGIIEKFKKLFE
jgi:outer membrane protein assembly factor BamD